MTRRAEREITFAVDCLSNLCAFCSLPKICRTCESVINGPQVRAEHERLTSRSLLPVASNAELSALTASSHSSSAMCLSARPTRPHTSSGLILSTSSHAAVAFLIWPREM